MIENDNIPYGYKELGKSPTNNKRIAASLILAGIFIAAFLMYLLYCVTYRIEILNTTNSMAFTQLTKCMIMIGALLIAVVIPYFQQKLHERIHGVFIRLFTGEEPIYGHTRLFEYAVPKPGKYLCRTQAIIALIAPTIIFGISGIILFIPNLFLKVLMIYILCITCFGCVLDVFTIIWLLCYPKSAQFGYDGVTSILIGPKSPN